MAAMSENANISVVGGACIVPMVANATDVYYAGAIVYIDDAGGAQVTTTIAADTAAGICPNYQSVTAGDEVEVLIEGALWIPTPTGIAAADEGHWLCIDATGATDNLDDCDSSEGLTLADNDMIVGKILRVDSSRGTLIYISATHIGLRFDVTGGGSWLTEL